MKQWINEYKEAEQYKNPLLRIEKKVDGIWRRLNEIETRFAKEQSKETEEEKLI